jgi:hypothetical protein
MDKEDREKDKEVKDMLARIFPKKSYDYYDNPNWKIKLFRGFYWVYSIGFIASIPAQEWMTLIRTQLMIDTRLSLDSIMFISGVIEWLIIIPVVIGGFFGVFYLELKLSKTKWARWLEK